MKLLTKSMENKFKKTGIQNGVLNPLVIGKFFSTTSTWYATEYRAKSFMGMICGTKKTELGYFSLDELERQPMIKRDMSFGEKPLHKAMFQDGYKIPHWVISHSIY